MPLPTEAGRVFKPPDVGRGECLVILARLEDLHVRFEFHCFGNSEHVGRLERRWDVARHRMVGFRCQPMTRPHVWVRDVR